ncbi:MAG: hypothetical protein AABX03_03410 [Nanoarchaeota archaeon]
MSKEGFKNEKKIINYLNGKQFKELNSSWKIFLATLFSKSIPENTKIVSFEKAGQNKSDVAIQIDNTIKTISVKSGTGNSVHQEPIEDFIYFLSNSYNISNSLANDLRLFIWGDETFDGKGKVEDRLSASKFKKKYPIVIERIQNFFDQYNDDLIKRFVVTGLKSQSSPDYIYYGNKNKGVWKKSKKVLGWLCDKANESKGAISVGGLTFQAWNRNINGGNKSEKKRGVIQLKWGSIGKDLKKIK